MSKYSKSNNNNNPPSNPSCFTSIFQRLICTGNLPTHSSPPDQILKKPDSRSLKRRSLTNVNGSDVAVQVQANSGPGVIARLMGLDTLPNYENTTTLDSLFRSKSLNSIQFLPDFDPTRAAFHRRARTSASFHEQGRNHFNFFLANGDKLENDTKQIKKAATTNECKKNRVKDSGSKKKRYEECYTSTNCGSSSRRLRNNVVSKDDLREKCRVQKRKSVNNKGKLNGKVVGSSIVVSRKKKVDHKQDMICIEVQSDDQLLSRSPVSVLDHSNKEISPFSKGEGRQLTSKSRRKSSPKIKINDNLPEDIAPKSRENYQDYCNRIASKQVLEKADVEAADDFVEMLGNICKLAEEEHQKDTKWVKKYKLLKVHFVEDLSTYLGQELLDLLLDELLLDEIVMSL